jgi:LemA protein
MSGLKGVLAVVLAVVLAGVLIGGCSYNKFTTQEQTIKKELGEIENQLQRRHDLIPNLVETTKGFAQQEKDVFQAVADARTRYAGATTTQEKMAAGNAEQSAIARLLVVMENYPQLKSDQLFINLQYELSGTENRISTARGRYNTAVNEYETSRHRFPANLTASLFGFKEYPYFDAAADAKAVPKVDFSKGK